MKYISKYKAEEIEAILDAKNNTGEGADFNLDVLFTDQLQTKEVRVSEDTPIKADKGFLGLKEVDVKMRGIELFSSILIDQSITDPTKIITGDINGEAIRKIRSESHRYLGKSAGDGVMTICQLADEHSERYYADGTLADLTGAEGDVFMKLPTFYYQVIKEDADKWRITFCYSRYKPEGDDWQTWDGNQLIGVYECSVLNQKMYSVAGVNSSASILIDKFRTFASARGKGYSAVKWKHHNMMAFLFYAMYGTTDSQSVIGYGDGSSNKLQGLSNHFGMVDTKPSDGQAIGAINFWGLENWWGNKWETIDDVEYQYPNYIIQENPQRVITAYKTTTTEWPTALYIGEHLDCIPIRDGGSGTTGYCDTVDTSTSPANKYRLCRGGRTAAESCGVIALVGQNKDISFSTVTSRLAFTGEIRIENDVETFKAI